MNLTLADAVVAAAKAEAERSGFAVAIWVLDSAAHPLAFARMDGANLGPLEVAHKKARTAALFDTDSLRLGQAARPGGAIYTLEHTNGGLVSFGGGVVLRDRSGAAVGAVGVAGATVEADEAIAQTAAAVLRV